MASLDAGQDTDGGLRLDGGEVAHDSGLNAVDAGNPMVASGPYLYPSDQIQSPISPWMVEQWRTLLAQDSSRKDDVFAKVGDSITVSDHFMKCFDFDHVDLAGQSEWSSTLAHFRDGDASGTSPFARDSLAAKVGGTARWSLESTPSLLSQELTAISPAFAFIMFGTNDVGIFDVFDFSDDMLGLIDATLSQSVLPIMSTIPPRDDSELANESVFNALLRAIAQARGVPLIDFHQALVAMEDHGLGVDGVHPTAYRNNAGLRACSFGSEGLKHGYNVRNRLSLEALHRIKSTVLDGENELLASSVKRLNGQGTDQQPYLIESLPFSDLRDTTQSGQKRIDSYPGCSATQDESGAELYYRLELFEKTKLRAMVFDRGDVDIDVHLLLTEPSGEACIQRDHNQIAGEFEAGVYYFSLDTFVTSSGEASGEYLFLVMKTP